MAKELHQGWSLETLGDTVPTVTGFTITAQTSEEAFDTHMASEALLLD